MNFSIHGDELAIIAENIAHSIEDMQRLRDIMNEPDAPFDDSLVDIEIILPVREEAAFDPTSFRRNDLGFGISIISAKLITNPLGPLIVQAIAFDSDQWTEDEARRWFETRKDQFSFTATDKTPGTIRQGRIHIRKNATKGDPYIPKRYDGDHSPQKAALGKITGVEIFKVGTWNGDEFTIEHLDHMVSAFNDTRSKVRPALKLGHSENQELLKKEGLPAAGFIGRVYRKGETLLADFVDIPRKIFQLIKNKAYTKVSLEVYFNATFNDRFYPRMISACSFLGNEIPAVDTLNDILALYGINADELRAYAKEDKSDNIKKYEIDFNNNQEIPMPKTESELKLELEVKALKEAADYAKEAQKKFTKETEATAKQLADLTTAKDAADSKASDLAAKLETQTVSTFCTEMETEELITPAMRPYIVELMGPDKKEYTIKTKKEDVKLNKASMIKEICKLFKATSDVNFDENSEEGEHEGDPESAAEVRINKYMTDNPKVTYAAAVRKVGYKKK